MTKMPTLPLRRTGALLALFAFALYFPALRYGFVKPDDHSYVVDNLQLRFLDRSLLQWSCTTLQNANWHPLTWLSLAADYALWGPNPAAFHLHNIILHCLNIFLVLLLTHAVLTRSAATLPAETTLGRPRAAFAIAVVCAVIFGLHPLRVESVAWVSQRKDVLCAFCYLLSLLAYLRYTTEAGDGTSERCYLCSLAFFCLSLGAKAMAVSLPLVLLLLDLYLPSRPSARRPRSAGRLLLEKVPFLPPALGAGFLALRAQAAGGASGSPSGVALLPRTLNALHAAFFYPWKTVFPTDLSPLYPFPGNLSPGDPELLVALLGAIALTLYCLKALLSGNRAWLALWAGYLVMLLPVLGLVQIGAQRAADRYSYLPSLVISLALSLWLAGLWEILARYSRPRGAVRLAAFAPVAALVLCLSWSTRGQLQVWQDSLSVAQREVEVTPEGASLPYQHRGVAWLDRNEVEKAFWDCDRALRVDPNCLKCLMCRAEANERRADYPAAIADYSAVLQLNPVYAEALCLRGEAYQAVGDQARAEADVQLRWSVERH